jgi:DNA-binding Xre family transcriptional regulator
MALEVNVRDMAQSHGIKSAAVLRDRTGLAYNVAIRYWQGGQMERVSMTTLVTIAKAIGCSAKDLLVEREALPA